MHHVDDGMGHCDELLGHGCIFPTLFGGRVAREDDGDVQVSRGPNDLFQPMSTTRETPCNNRDIVEAAHGVEVLDELHELHRYVSFVIACDIHVGIPAWPRAIAWYVELACLSFPMSCLRFCVEATSAGNEEDQWHTSYARCVVGRWGNNNPLKSAAVISCLSDQWSKRR